MKKIILIGLVLASSLMSYAQKLDTTKSLIQKNAEAIGHGGNNELKINLLFMAIGMPEISYERLLTDNVGVGATVLIGFDKDVEYNFSFTPHYRLYFGSIKASGFFIEGNSSVVKTDGYADIYNPVRNSYSSKDVTATYFGLGAAAGTKLLTRSGFFGEAYYAVSYLFENKHSYPYHSPFQRVGLTLGKRF